MILGGVEIPPGASVMLKPGGYHIMFMDLKAPFAKGNRIPVTLVFEKAGTVEIEYTVEAIGSQGSGGSTNSGGHHRH